MKLIVGLGNPGKVYADSRHNIGFLVVRSLAQRFKVTLKRGIFSSSLTAKFKASGEDIVLAMPLTYMNLSGVAVKALVKKYKISPENLLVVCDDLDLDFGRIKIRGEGSCGGHNGLESVINSLGSDKFSRLRIGIGRPSPKIDAVDYVLGNFTKKEKERLVEIKEEAVRCCVSWATTSLDECMNIFNSKKELR